MHRAPSERTLRRVLAGVDGDELDRQTCRYLGGQAAIGESGEGQASERCAETAEIEDVAVHLWVGMGVERETRRARQRARQRPDPAGVLAGGAADGKALRGARHGEEHGPQLLSLLHHTRGVVLGQRRIADKTSEVPELAPLLLDALACGDIAVVTVDALHTVRETARHLSEDLGLYYVMILKENQLKALAAAMLALAGGTDAAHERAATGHTDLDKGHGRRERRTIRTAAADAIDFPHAAQVFRIVRQVAEIGGPGVSKEVAYGITNAPPDVAGPAHLGILYRVKTRPRWL
ncbi:ISAs1 family transposase [Nonomuraea sp. K274]|uniref:ISAs1 family transposase n=1 Tax=Nonomuraea cypriaca TaxID=1187855 RepID=A0A931AID8_9ACTN|nr:ISAs1 family transposase [Nonomuraea cypriaca]MBF8190705.1 ISAs1 family transposase [Nonomuraea cypriaca]